MKRALITGGSGAIGQVICQELATQKLHVIVHGSSHPDQAAEVADRIIQAGGSAESVCFDITNAEATQKALEGLLNDGLIQVVVNNAGVYDDAPMAGMTSEQWTRVIDVSLHGFFNVTQPLLLPMMGTRWGRIVTISSVAGVRGHRGQTNYAAAKAGLHGASKSLAHELATRGITVNVVAPGLVNSPMTAQVFDQNQIDAIVPMKRAGTPAEVAYLVGFLVSDKASYISGQVIGINGGMT
jgi:3-oxoacyl-[acyl-carrier protein] reductase